LLIFFFTTFTNVLHKLTGSVSFPFAVSAVPHQLITSSFLSPMAFTRWQLLYQIEPPMQQSIKSGSHWKSSSNDCLVKAIAAVKRAERVTICFCHFLYRLMMFFVMPGAVPIIYSFTPCHTMPHWLT